MRICNKCKKSVTPDFLGFEGKFPDYHFNSEIELCNDCTLGFKKIFDDYCGVTPSQSEQEEIILEQEFRESIKTETQKDKNKKKVNLKQLIF